MKTHGPIKACSAANMYTEVSRRRRGSRRRSRGQGRFTFSVFVRVICGMCERNVYQASRRRRGRRRRSRGQGRFTFSVFVRVICGICERICIPSFSRKARKTQKKPRTRTVYLQRIRPCDLRDLRANMYTKFLAEGAEEAADEYGLPFSVSFRASCGIRARICIPSFSRKARKTQKKPRTSTVYPSAYPSVRSAGSAREYVYQSFSQKPRDLRC